MKNLIALILNWTLVLLLVPCSITLNAQIQLKQKMVIKQLAPQPKCDRSALPDLHVTHVDMGGPWKPGARHSARIIVENRGQFESGEFYIEVEIRVQNEKKDITRSMGKKKMGSLSPVKTSGTEMNGTSTATFFFISDNSAYATYSFLVKVDSTNHIEEFDEDNNHFKSKDFKIHPM